VAAPDLEVALGARAEAIHRLLARQAARGAHVVLGREARDVTLDAVEHGARVGVRLLAAALALKTDEDRHVARHIVVASRSAVRAEPVDRLQVELRRVDRER
jgi:hypothetical protein